MSAFSYYKQPDQMDCGPSYLRMTKKLETMGTWCTGAEITATPTIFVNGHRLPENYDIEELRYIL